MRKTAHKLASFFTKRFSPTVFNSHEIQPDEIEAILEAASTAPSCFNEQPWRFVLAQKSKFHEILDEGNMKWCKSVEHFVLICAESSFRRNGKPNRFAWFDSGTAWGYMTMQAYELGIYLHAMAGFDSKKAVKLFDLEDLEPIAVVALGKDPVATQFSSRDPLEAKIIRR